MKTHSIPFEKVPRGKLLVEGTSLVRWSTVVTFGIGPFPTLSIKRALLSRTRVLAPDEKGARIERLAAHDKDDEPTVFSVRDDDAFAEEVRSATISGPSIKDGEVSISASYCAVEGCEEEGHTIVDAVLRERLREIASAALLAAEFLAAKEPR